MKLGERNYSLSSVIEEWIGQWSGHPGFLAGLLAELIRFT
jgi:hypothetical protein